MTAKKASALGSQISGARVVPLHTETARLLGGGASGRTLALVYAQLQYWSKWAKWKGSNNRKFFYKSAAELSAEIGFSIKTIQRAIKRLKELGFILIERLHQHFYKQVNFYFLPHSPYASAEPVEAETPVAAATPRRAPEPRRRPESASALTTTSDRGIPTGVSASTGSAEAHPAALVMSASVRSRGLRREGHFDPLLTQDYTHSKKHTFDAILAKCLKISDEMRNNNGMRNISAGFI
jgi:biotin operon repressor